MPDVTFPFPGRAYADGLFSLDRTHGFLPVEPPLHALPSPFEPVQALIDALPVVLPPHHADAGTPGLLGRDGAIAEAVAALPDLHDAADALDPDDPRERRVIAALFRSYAFLASAFLLEPAHRGLEATGRYGEARRALPAQLARPLVAVADKLGVHPWLDYHYAYSLYNWRTLDPSLPAPERYRWDNLDMCARFSGMPDEVGFIMLHVHIDAHSGALLGAYEDALEAARARQLPALRAALARTADTLVTINEVRKEMWNASRWPHYNDFRVFIMGITGNTALFGDGVRYEGVARYGEQPMQFRGQSGSQDDIIPSADIFAGVTPYYPDNELTRYLLDMRAYRPPVVRRFLDDLAAARDAAGLLDVTASDPEATLQLLRVVEQIYAFRNGHWQFVQKYILATTRYPVATGGTPVTTWIPNQIEATLKYMADLLDRLGAAPLPEGADAERARIRDLYPRRVAILQEQVAELSQTAWDAALVYDLNVDLAEGPPPAAAAVAAPSPTRAG